MVHIDVITFLTKLTQTYFIDQLLMDNEGQHQFFMTAFNNEVFVVSVGDTKKQ